VRYVVQGPLFFGSSNDLVEHFSYAADPPQVVIDFSGSQIWDASSVAALDAVVMKYRQHGIATQIVGLDDRSSLFHGKLTGLLR
jgi:SulP family sulfate permease